MGRIAGKEKEEYTVRTKTRQNRTNILCLTTEISIPKNRKCECTNEAQTLVVWAFSNFNRNLRTIIFKKSIINL